MCVTNVDKNVGNFLWSDRKFKLFKNFFGLLQTWKGLIVTAFGWRGFAKNSQNFSCLCWDFSFQLRINLKRCNKTIDTVIIVAGIKVCATSLIQGISILHSFMFIIERMDRYSLFIKLKRIEVLTWRKVDITHSVVDGGTARAWVAVVLLVNFKTFSESLHCQG